MDSMVQGALAQTTPAELADEAIVDRVRGGDTALYEILVRSAAPRPSRRG